MSRALLALALLTVTAAACSREVRPGACLERPDLFVDKTRRVTRFVRDRLDGADESCRLVCAHISVEGPIDDAELTAVLEVVRDAAGDPITHVHVGARDAVDAGVTPQTPSAVTVTTGVGCAPLQGEGTTYDLRREEAGAWSIDASSIWAS